jgi:DNA-binding CsgD family transcriptional regulator
MELQGLSLLFELEKKELGPLITELADGMTGRWARAWSLYADAQGHQDAAACLEAGETIRGLGTIKLARDCFARAALLYEATGDRLGVRQSTTRRDYCERELGEQSGADSESTSSAVVLTRRERDIITLAVQGLTDRQIAEKLMVSVRTVEGHLYRSYVKLGIRSREELSEAAGL